MAQSVGWKIRTGWKRVPQGCPFEPSASYAMSPNARAPKGAQARLAAIVTSSADAIVGKTLDGIVTSWNEGAERMLGYSAGDMMGQSIRRVVPIDSRRRRIRSLPAWPRASRHDKQR
jgi:PAS domain-containing protein